MNIRKITALILALMLLTVSLAGCTEKEDNSQLLAQLQQENQQLRSEVDALRQQIAELEAGSISDWSLTGTPLVQGSGASVALSVVPTRYQEGQMVSFRVQLDGQTVADLYCDWDGSAYTAGVELDAADGYSYSIILTEPNGRQQYLELNSPANPVDPMLVYMYSSLNASCTLSVTDWQIQEGTLSILSGLVEVQLPMMTSTGEQARCAGLNLVLMLNGEELSRKTMMIPQTEDSFLSIPLDETVFEIPELEEGAQLDLWLEARLSDEQILTHSGSSWFCFEGEIVQAVG